MNCSRITVQPRGWGRESCLFCKKLEADKQVWLNNCQLSVWLMVNKTGCHILIIETNVLIGKRWEVVGYCTFHLFLVNLAETFKHPWRHIEQKESYFLTKGNDSITYQIQNSNYKVIFIKIPYFIRKPNLKHFINWGSPLFNEICIWANFIWPIFLS